VNKFECLPHIEGTFLYYTVLRYILIYTEHTVYYQLSCLLDTLTLCKISKSFFPDIYSVSFQILTCRRKTKR